MTRPSRTGSPSCGTGVKPRGRQLELVGDTAAAAAGPSLRLLADSYGLQGAGTLRGPGGACLGEGSRCVPCLPHCGVPRPLGAEHGPWCPHLPGCPSGKRPGPVLPKSPAGAPPLLCTVARGGHGVAWGSCSPSSLVGGPWGTCGLAQAEQGSAPAREAGCCCVLRNRPPALGPHWSWASSRGPSAPGLVSASPTPAST